MANKLSATNLKKAWKMKGTTRKNALKRAWALQKRKSSKSKTTKRKTTKKRKRSVAKRKTTRRKTSKRIPLSVITGLVTSIYAPPNPGWGSTIEKVQGGRMDEAAQSFLAAWTGVRMGGIGGQVDTEIDIMGIINPFDMRNAPALKVTLWTKLATKVARKLIGNPFSRIPFVKDYVSFA